VSLERFAWVEKHSLGHKGLLVLKHLFTLVPNHAELVHIQLHFVLVELKSAEDTQSIAYSDIVLTEP
jgi:hypothetical protein